MDENISFFILNLNAIVREIEKIFPNNGEILSFGNKIKIFKNEIGRKELVKVFGGVLYNYERQIRQNDVQFFLNIDNLKDSINSNKKIVVELFKTISNKYSELPDCQKKFLFDKFNALLDNYEVVMSAP